LVKGGIMADSQGTSSFVGSFLNGYMGQMANQQQQKLKKVSDLMDIAERYRRMAEDPAASDEVYSHAQEQMQGILDEAHKTMNAKNNGLGTIMSLFGFGKGKGGQGPNQIPRALFQPTSVPGTQPGGGAMPYPMTQPGETSGAMSPRPMPQPGVTPIATAPQDDSVPAEFRGMPLSAFMNQPGSSAPASIAPVAQPTPSQYDMTGLSHMAKMNLRQQQVAGQMGLDQQGAAERQRADINQEYSHRNYVYQRQQQEAQTAKDLAVFRSNPNYGKDPEYDRSMESHIQYGYVPKEPTPITKQAPDWENEEPVTNIYSNGKVVSTMPRTLPHDAQLQAIKSEFAAKGITLSTKQADVEYGKRLNTEMQLNENLKNISIEARKQGETLRGLRINALQDKANNAGKMTPQMAEALMKGARAAGAAELARAISERTKESGALRNMTMAQRTQWIEDYAKQQTSDIAPWDELTRTVNPAKPVAPTPKQEEKNFRSLIPGASTATPAPAPVRQIPGLTR
jgi:hypothetical protein